MLRLTLFKESSLKKISSFGVCFECEPACMYVYVYVRMYVCLTTQKPSYEFQIGGKVCFVFVLPCKDATSNRTLERTYTQSHTHILTHTLIHTYLHTFSYTCTNTHTHITRRVTTTKPCVPNPRLLTTASPSYHAINSALRCFSIRYVHVCMCVYVYLNVYQVILQLIRRSFRYVCMYICG
jgi:hypothetical protein